MKEITRASKHYKYINDNEHKWRRGAVYMAEPNARIIIMGTDLRTKDGIEIYEGDRVFSKVQPESDEEAKQMEIDGYIGDYGTVRYHNGKFVVSWDGSSFEDELYGIHNMVEIVGNIYDKEL